MSNNFVPVYKKNITFSQGKGVWLWDSNGKKYLDFMSGIAVNILGHADERWMEAVKNQLEKLVHVSNYYHSESEKALAKKLVEISFADKVFFSNSGTEANEAALKFARKFSKQQGNEEKIEVISFSRGFHGRTMGALSTTHSEKYRLPFSPLVPSVHFCEFNNRGDFLSKISEKTAAVILEPIQGEGGIFSAEKNFLEFVKKECEKNNTVLIFDEVQCGLGRTGKLFAYEHFGVIPDILTLAKPLAGGIPMGATLVSEKISAAMNPGDHGNTFGGNALACASALHILERLQEKNFLKTVEENGKFLAEQLQEISAFKNFPMRQMGLMLAVDFPEEISVQEFIQKCAENGLLVISAGKNSLRILPPLNISKAALVEGLKIMHDIFQQYFHYA